MQDYHDDSPLDGDEDDIFGRWPYAKKVADVLEGFDNDSCYVIGLYSKWGYGKTSTINMIKKSLEGNGNVETLDLEPWNYSSDKELAASLLYELLDKVRILRKTGRLVEFFRKKSKKVSELISKIAPSANFKSSDNVTISTGNIAATTLALVNLLSFTREYKFQKQGIEKALRENNKRLIVFIDDIDRLDPEKILNVFKLVKSVANIKGVTYLLSFDEQVVSDAISESLPKKQGGKEYVDKIIQIPIVLPLIDRFDLDEYVDKKINAILAQNQIVVEDDRWRDLQLLYQKVKYKLDTPRSVNRFANCLLFAVPLIKDEVNIVDLISIELLRVTYPELYEHIRNNKDLLTKTSDYSSGGYWNDQEEVEKVQQDYKKAFADNEEWLELLSIIFPNVKKYYSRNIVYSQDEPSANRRNKRLRSYEYFNRYFTYSIGRKEVSDVEFFKILESPKPSAEELTALLRGDPRRTLQKIEDNKDVITNAAAFTKALVGSLDGYLDQSKGGLLQLNLIDNALFLIDDIFTGQASSKILEMYLGILKLSDAASTISHIIRHVNAAHNKTDTKILSDDEFGEFKRASIVKINQLIEKKKLPIDDHETMANYLYEFVNLFEGKSDRVNKYMRQQIKTGTQAVDFISQFIGKWSHLGSSENYRSDLIDDSSTYIFWFKDKLDADYLYGLLAKNRKYKKYMGIKKDELSRFERHNNDEINLAGKEKTPAFRDIIAQQFIFLYEQNSREAS